MSIRIRSIHRRDRDLKFSFEFVDELIRRLNFPQNHRFHRFVGLQETAARSDRLQRRIAIGLRWPLTLIIFRRAIADSESMRRNTRFVAGAISAKWTRCFVDSILGGGLGAWLSVGFDMSDATDHSDQDLVQWPEKQESVWTILRNQPSRLTAGTLIWRMATHRKRGTRAWGSTQWICGNVLDLFSRSQVQLFITNKQFLF